MMLAKQKEDWHDLAALENRASEPTMSYEALLNDLKAHGKLLADHYRS